MTATILANKIGAKEKHIFYGKNHHVALSVFENCLIVYSYLV